VHTAFLVFAIIALAIQGLILFLAFFGPDLRYRIAKPPPIPLDSEYFLSLLCVLTDAPVHRSNRVDVLTNGNCFYEAELNGIRSAKRTIHLEAYIFHRGEIGQRFVEAMTERAVAGVKVRIVIDFIGSFSTRKHYFKPLIKAGGSVKWYHSFRPDLLPQINHRTHRELLIVDGTTAFIGGAGISDQWYKGAKNHPRWRDTVAQVHGPAVSSLQATFAQNWLRVAGEILAAEEDFDFRPADGGSTALVVNSTPEAGSTRARILFQALIACAKKRIYITTPYFLPDKSARQALAQAVRERNVEVKIITPGVKSDHPATRGSSRHLYGSLLKDGVDVYEYQPAMIHAKTMMVDDVWAVVGSTNFDQRSFQINDEVNMAVLDAAVVERVICSPKTLPKQDTI